MTVTGYREEEYSVPAIESLGDYGWRSTLEIDNVRSGEEDKTHVMVVTRKDVNDVSRK